MLRLALCSLIVLVPQAMADDKSDAELKALVGKWEIVKSELGGMDITDHLKALKFEISAGGKYFAQLGEEKDEGSFTIDLAKKPKEMDIKSTGGPNKDKLVKAIYKLDGDELVVCYELGGDGDRPLKFETKKDTKQLLATYKRKK
ncbi:MAG: TIGR03067 domain-containing protein [Gemmataceae bacterium]